MVIPVAQHPCFPDRAIAGKRSGEQVSQAPPTPESILVNRLEPERI
jgi:hypothetical protein